MPRRNMDSASVLPVTDDAEARTGLLTMSASEMASTVTHRGRKVDRVR